MVDLILQCPDHEVRKLHVANACSHRMQGIVICNNVHVNAQSSSLREASFKPDEVNSI